MGRSPGALAGGPHSPAEAGAGWREGLKYSNIQYDFEARLTDGLHFMEEFIMDLYMFICNYNESLPELFICKDSDNSSSQPATHPAYLERVNKQVNLKSTNK